MMLTTVRISWVASNEVPLPFLRKFRVTHVLSSPLYLPFLQAVTGPFSIHMGLWGAVIVVTGSHAIVLFVQWYVTDIVGFYRGELSIVKCCPRGRSPSPRDVKCLSDLDIWARLWV